MKLRLALVWLHDRSTLIEISRLGFFTKKSLQNLMLEIMAIHVRHVASIAKRCLEVLAAARDLVHLASFKIISNMDTKQFCNNHVHLQKKVQFAHFEHILQDSR